MAILHTWCCAAHGEFQSFSEACPQGCDASMVHKVLGCAISVGRSKDTANMVDRKMVDIANQFGVSDLNIRGGSSAAPGDYRWNESDNIKRMRIAGQSYAVPVDPKGDVCAQAGVSGDTNMLAEMKDQIQMKVHVDPRLSDNSALPEAA